MRGDSLTIQIDSAVVTKMAELEKAIRGLNRQGVHSFK